MMGTFCITTGKMLLRQFIEYCDDVYQQEDRNVCEENGFNTFLTVPISNGICAVLWVSISMCLVV